MRHFYRSLAFLSVLLPGCRPDPDGELVMGLWERRVSIVRESESAAGDQSRKGGAEFVRSFCISSADQYTGIRAFDRLLVDGDCSSKILEFAGGRMSGSATCFLDEQTRQFAKLRFSGTYRNGNRIDAMAELDWPDETAGARTITMKVTLEHKGNCFALYPGKEVQR